MQQTLNGGIGPFNYSAAVSGNPSGSGTELWQGTSGVNILAAGGVVSNLAVNTDTFIGSATLNSNTKNPLTVAVFAPSVPEPSCIALAGSIAFFPFMRIVLAHAQRK